MISATEVQQRIILIVHLTGITCRILRARQIRDLIGDLATLLQLYHQYTWPRKEAERGAFMQPAQEACSAAALPRWLTVAG